MNKIWLIGDTHGTWKNLQLFQHAKNDYIIVLGDFGFIWNRSTKELNTIERMFGRNNTTLLFIDGNHENFDILETYPIVEKFGGRVRKISDHVYHLMRGEIFTILDQKIFAMGGAGSIDKNSRTEFVSWWKQENITHADFENAYNNIVKHGNEVDYVITHTAPCKIVETFYDGKTSDVNTKALTEIEKILLYKHWYFGHHHQDKTMGNFTILYNKKMELGQTF
jgi:predicted phosphodiesterase